MLKSFKDRQQNNRLMIHKCNLSKATSVNKALSLFCHEKQCVLRFSIFEHTFCLIPLCGRIYCVSFKQQNNVMRKRIIRAKYSKLLVGH